MVVCNFKVYSKRDHFFITEGHDGRLVAIAEQARDAPLSDDCDPSKEKSSRERGAMEEKRPKTYGGRGGAFPVVSECQASRSDQLGLLASSVSLGRGGRADQR
ncbi:hypothetical protein RAD15_09690 [Bradyrhizobium sp. 14AA]